MSGKRKTNARSARTGRYVKQSYADKHPNTTVRERRSKKK